MLNIYKDTRILDRKAISESLLTEDILMENAAAALEKEVWKQLKKRDRSEEMLQVLILTGPGNNGGDGMTLARRLAGNTDCRVFMLEKPASTQCIIQYKRALAAGVKFTEKLQQAQVVVDCIYGSGFHGELPEKTSIAVGKVNSWDSYRIACDIPSGIDSEGQIHGTSFMAHITVTMGAMKTPLFSDMAKDFTGKIKVADLGISSELFQQNGEAAAFLLEKKDLQLPERISRNTNKGSFGHVAVVMGEKPGAGVIAASAAFNFGAGLVTLVSKNGIQLDNTPFHLMTSTVFPKNTTAAAVGMGLGTPDQKLRNWLGDKADMPCVMDADLFKYPGIQEMIEERENLVITPHPKEFASLLELCGLGKYTAEEIQTKRMELTGKFCAKFSQVVLVLKGANTIIGYNDEIYINPWGQSCLSKGGSGDVLAGLIASLMAQGWSSFQAAIQGSLAHSLASEKIKCSYGMSPFDLIEEVKKLEQR